MNKIQHFATVDKVGGVFFYNNRVFRAINNEMQAEVTDIINSDLLERLISKKLFPKTFITSDVSLKDHSMILEHERIPFITYPYEWSFNMVKDALIAYLKVCKECADFSYTLKDGHLYNMAFNEGQPVFFDFGSITLSKEFLGAHEFLNTGVIPLKLWAKGDFYLANLIFRDSCSSFRFLPSDPLSYHRATSHVVPFLERKWPHFVRKCVNYFSRLLIKRNLFNATSLSIPSLLNQLDNTKRPSNTTMWSDYHDGCFADMELKKSSRFDRLIEIIKTLDVQSMIDLAGNSGAFSLLVEKNTTISKIVCSDYDETAIDKLYMHIKRTANKKILPMLLNFVLPINSYHRSVFERVRCDIAVALAVYHHLLLTQKMSLDNILEMTGKYSNRYVLVEFMPLGLWNGTTSLPLPPHYTLDWFRNTFKNHFTLLCEEQTEPNRVFFLGEKLQ